MSGYAVIVFSFPEPEDQMTMGLIIESSREAFKTIPNVKAHLAISETADDIIAMFDPLHKEDSNLVKHAKEELTLLGEDPEFAKSLVAAVRGFSSFGHSGGSQGVAVSMLMQLLTFGNLSPLTDDPDEWNLLTEEQWPVPSACWQSKRNPAAFSLDAGRTYYLTTDGSTQSEQKKMYTSEKRVKETDGPRTESDS